MRPVSDVWDASVRAGYTPTVRAEVWRGDVLVRPVEVVSGEVSSQESSKVRTSATLTLALDPRPVTGASGMGAFVPTGDVHALLDLDDTDIRLWVGMQRGDGTTEEVPVLWGRVTSYGRGGMYEPVRVAVSDYAHVMQQARLVAPWVTPAGMPVVSEIRSLVQDVHPGIRVVDATGMVPAPVTRAATWERDRWDAVESLASSIGCEVFFTGERVLVVRPVPQVSASAVPVWTLDAGTETSVLTDVEVGADRPGWNAVVASSSASQEQPVSAVAYSPSWRAGVKRPRFYASPMLTTVAQCEEAATAILARSMRYARDVTPEAVPNYALEVGDLVAVTVPGDLDERRIVTGVRYPLGAVGPMGVDTRVAVGVETTLSVGDLS